MSSSSTNPRRRSTRALLRRASVTTAALGVLLATAPVTATPVGGCQFEIANGDRVSFTWTSF
ncbi:hypothetical protein [Streptomyces sp. NPDC052494]|uniref:hypothetical protein n=1 Tax=Streptomyces sp. NPDC052494 TaxID=3365692 RepID=UPI0037D44D20